MAPRNGTEAPRPFRLRNVFMGNWVYGKFVGGFIWCVEEVMDTSSVFCAVHVDAPMVREVSNRDD